MSRFPAAALVVVTLLSSCSLLKPKTPEEYGWETMCRLVDREYGYSCKGIELPKVVYEPMEGGLQGWYGGGDTVHVREGLPLEDRMATLIHEYVHYLHVQLDMLIVPGPAREICWSESEAWHITELVTGKDTSNWWRAYPHCWQFNLLPR